jgi:5-methylcytosine-specific restriction enzyme subunit McrC
MPRLLTLFEHESIPFDWTERDWTLVDKMNTALQTDALRLGMKRGEKRIQAAQHVGVVRLGNRTIQILPKIYAHKSADEKGKAKEATANLLRMLAYAGELPVREHELATLLRQTDDWFEILTRLFTTHLREEWQRGAHRTYQTLEDELPVLKGKWRIAHQLRRPMRKHIFSVAYDEFTADNKLNRVFRYVVERLWHLTRDNDNRQILGELRQWMEEVTLLPRVTVADANTSQLSRLNERYRPLLNLAQVFLDGGALQMAAGTLTTFAFVFDMNQLFESFIAAFIRRHSSEILSDRLQACDFLTQSRGARLNLARHGEKEVFQTRPDIAFRDSERQFPLLIDTKYKRLDEADRRLGVSQPDFYQMHAYAHRYACHHIILLYPQAAEAASSLNVSFTLEDCEKVIQAGTVDLRIDMSSKQERQKLICELKALFPQENPHE